MTSKDGQEEPGISDTNQDTLCPIGSSLLQERGLLRMVAGEAGWTV